MLSTLEYRDQLIIETEFTLTKSAWAIFGLNYGQRLSRAAWFELGSNVMGQRPDDGHSPISFYFVIGEA